MINTTAGHQDVRLLLQKRFKKKKKKEIEANFLLGAQRKESQVFKGVEEPKYKVGIFRCIIIFR